MGEEKHTQNDDPELLRLRLKSEKGLMNILDKLLENPEFQKRINRAFVKQSLKMGLFLSCFVVGTITLLNMVKAIWNIGWVGDLAFGIALLLIGLAYIVRETYGS